MLSTRVLTAALFLGPLAVAALGQAKRPPVVPFKFSKISPLKVAQAVDAAMAGLTHMDADYHVVISLRGKGGDSGKLMLENSRKFNLQYPSIHYIGSEKDYPISRVFVVSDGTTVSVKGSQIKSKHPYGPLKSYRADVATSVSDWLFGLPKYILAGISGEHPLTNLVRLAQSPSSDFQVTTDERTLRSGKKIQRQVRLSFTRRPKFAQKLGVAVIGIVIDLGHRLPVSAGTESVPRDNPQVLLAWTISWRKHHGQFAPNTFRVFKNN